MITDGMSDVVAWRSNEKGQMNDEQQNLTQFTQSS